MGGELFIPILAIVGFFSSIIIFVYLFFTSRSKERMALLEHNKDADIFHGLKNQIESLKFGMVGIMAGVGLIIGYFLDKSGMEEFVAYFSMVLIFGGIGLVGFYFLNKRQDKDNSDITL